ncbi:MAG: DUF938 domain-containing protein, partial [Pseudomonadota bacterium]
MSNTKPFQRSCEQNKGPLLAVLEVEFASSSCLLEIGSGTGQHAVFFAQHLPHLSWQCGDVKSRHDGINAWISEYPRKNLLRPIEVDIPDKFWKSGSFDAHFSANTAHIMNRTAVKAMMAAVSDTLPIGGVFCQYGPFTQDGDFSTSSNLEFHRSLVERGYGGYRDTQELIEWAPALTLDRIVSMPANNLTLVWRKVQKRNS